MGFDYHWEIDFLFTTMLRAGLEVHPIVYPAVGGYSLAGIKWLDYEADH
jgi:hypothetical protein